MGVFNKDGEHLGELFFLDRENKNIIY